MVQRRQMILTIKFLTSKSGELQKFTLLSDSRLHKFHSGLVLHNVKICPVRPELKCRKMYRFMELSLLKKTSSQHSRNVQKDIVFHLT